jgi:hypothetical protein
MSPPDADGLSFEDVRAADALLDELGGRSSAALGDEPEPVVRLLAALVDDVDRDLPCGGDPVVTGVLAARVAEVARARLAGDEPAVIPQVRVTDDPRPATDSQPAVDPGAAVDPVPVEDLRPADGRRASRRALRLGRGGAVLASMGLLVASAGVAAAVTGDPAGAFGLRGLSSLLSPDRSGDGRAAQLDWLRRRIDLAGQRPGGPDAREIAELRAEAARFAGPHAAQLQRSLDALRPVPVADRSGLPAVGLPGGVLMADSPLAPQGLPTGATESVPVPTPIATKDAPSATSPAPVDTGAGGPTTAPDPSDPPTSSPPTSSSTTTGSPTATESFSVTVTGSPAGFAIEPSSTEPSATEPSATASSSAERSAPTESVAVTPADAYGLGRSAFPTATETMSSGTTVGPG